MYTSKSGVINKVTQWLDEPDNRFMNKYKVECSDDNREIKIKMIKG